MLKRTTLFLLLATAVSAAMAQPAAGPAAHGEGLATNSANRGDHFAFNVKKVAMHGQTRVVGHFQFAFLGETPNRPPTLKIVMNHPDELGVEGAYAGFAGPATAIRMTNRGPVRTEGRLAVRVTDTRRRDVGDPDTLRFVFTPRTGEPISFEGVVSRGDIVVVPPPPPRSVIEAAGRGVVVGGDRRGEFLFNVRSETVGDRTNVRGSFHIKSGNREHPPVIMLNIPEVRRVAGEGNTATFAGPAVMTTLGSGEPVRVQGAMVVKVVDNRRGSEGRPDTIRLEFTATAGGDPVVFEGTVVTGDLVVHVR